MGLSIPSFLTPRATSNININYCLTPEDICVFQTSKSMLATCSPKPLNTKRKNKGGHTHKEECVSQIYTHSPSLSLSVGWTTTTCAKASGRREKLSLSPPGISPSVPRINWNFCFLSGCCVGTHPQRPWCGTLREEIQPPMQENITIVGFRKSALWQMASSYPTKSLAPFSGSFTYKMTTSPNIYRIPAVSIGSWNKKKPRC